MLIRSQITLLLSAAFACGPMIGCESLPGDEKTQGAVIGGVGGAVAGAAVAGDDDRLLGGLIGGALGAGGGYLIGAQVEKNNRDHHDEAIEASDRARDNPVSAADVEDASTADVNDDGFVTLDEVAAMEQADLSDKEMIQRLRKTQQVFELSDEQEDYLRDKGVSEKVISAMREMNREYAADNDNDADGGDVISTGD